MDSRDSISAREKSEEIPKNHSCSIIYLSGDQAYAQYVPNSDNFGDIRLKKSWHNTEATYFAIFWQNNDCLGQTDHMDGQQRSTSCWVVWEVSIDI